MASAALDAAFEAGKDATARRVVEEAKTQATEREEATRKAAKEAALRREMRREALERAVADAEDAEAELVAAEARHRRFAAGWKRRNATRCVASNSNVFAR